MSRQHDTSLTQPAHLDLNACKRRTYTPSCLAVACPAALAVCCATAAVKLNILSLHPLHCSLGQEGQGGCSSSAVQRTGGGSLHAGASGGAGASWRQAGGVCGVQGGGRCQLQADGVHPHQREGPSGSPRRHPLRAWWRVLHPRWGGMPCLLPTAYPMSWQLHPAASGSAVQLVLFWHLGAHTPMHLAPAPAVGDTCGLPMVQASMLRTWAPSLRSMWCSTAWTPSTR